MKIIGTILLVLLVSIITASPLYSQPYQYHGYQQANFNNTNRYPMFSLGYGNSYGGLGGQVAYKFNRLAVHAGLGYFDPSFYDGLEWMEPVPLFNVGAKYYFTNKENLYVDLSLGTYGVEAFYWWDQYYNEYVSEWTYITGPVFSGGVDYFFLKNLGVNLGLGMGVNLNHQEYAPDIGIVIVGFDLGVVLRILPARN